MKQAGKECNDIAPLCLQSFVTHRTLSGETFSQSVLKYNQTKPNQKENRSCFHHPFAVAPLKLEPFSFVGTPDIL
jgi:hypothetical protein